MSIQRKSITTPSMLRRQTQHLITGQQLMQMRFPKVLPKGTVYIILEAPPLTTKNHPIIDSADIPALNTVPPIATIDEVRNKLMVIIPGN